MANWFGLGKKAEIVKEASDDIGSMSLTSNKNTEGVMKAYIPEFLYKPPFGYPRKENLPLIRELARNPYIFSVIKTLSDEVASTNYKVAYKEGIESTPELEELKNKINRFLQNPNGNKDSFKQLLRAVTKDLLELDSGVFVKVFNKKQEFVQLFARDGGSFLKNPDIYGYMGDREDYITPVNINYAVTPESPDYSSTLRQYELMHKNTAAYFQYGWTAASLPVPFGKREIVYVMQNPRTDSVYGLSPIQILADIIMTLVYGANYNLDFYMNNNMPEGIITLLNAKQTQVDAFRKRMDQETRVKDKNTGFFRKIAFKIPVTNTETTFTPFQLDPKAMEVLPQQEWFTKIVWMAFGVTADEMGFTEKSNKSTGENQMELYKRKAVRPLLETLKYHIDMEIITEFGELAFESFEFKWDEYDIDQDIKQHQLYQMQINMGLKSPEMIAEDEGIDYSKVKKYQEERDAKELVMNEANSSNINKQSSEETKSINLKALQLKIGSNVKVIGRHAVLSGMIGKIVDITNNGEEAVYTVDFNGEKRDVFFEDEIKVIKQIEEGIEPQRALNDKIEVEVESLQPKEIYLASVTGLKSEEVELEKEFEKVLKERTKELMKALDQYKNGQLEKIQ